MIINQSINQFMMVMVMRILDEECDEGDDDNDDGRQTSEVTYKPAVQDNTFPTMIIYIFCWP